MPFRQVLEISFGITDNSAFKRFGTLATNIRRSEKVINLCKLI